MSERPVFPVVATDVPGQPSVTPELQDLYRRFERALLIPLWTEISGLMPRQPASRAIPHLAGSLPDLVAYLVGRSRGGVTTGDGGPAPDLAAWL